MDHAGEPIHKDLESRYASRIIPESNAQSPCEPTLTVNQPAAHGRMKRVEIGSKKPSYRSVSRHVVINPLAEFVHPARLRSVGSIAKSRERGMHGAEAVAPLASAIVWDVFR